MALLLRAVSQREALTPLALTVLAAVSYVPALYGGFVWDDAIFAEEPVIHAASGLRSIWFSPADIKNEGHYWPLVYSSFWLELAAICRDLLAKQGGRPTRVNYVGCT